MKKIGRAKSKYRKAQILKNKKKYISYQEDLVRNIKKFDDSILKEKCVELNIQEDKEEINNIIKILGKTLAATKNGIGLAAPQIGYTKCIIAMRPKLGVNNILFMINPKIVKKSDITVKTSEGCLSFPNIEVKTKRHKEITVEYINDDLKSYRDKFEGLKSVIIQHEIFHLSGKCSNFDEWKRLNNPDLIEEEKNDEKKDKIK